MTLLEIVQQILSDMDGDEVNSISDTAEAEQIARVVRSTYNNIMSKETWPHTRRVMNLIPSTDSEKPTHMTLPAAVKEVVTVNYNKATNDTTQIQYRECKYLGVDDFLRKLNTRDSTADNIETVVDPSGVPLLIQNDKAPTYFTSFDDTTLVFDSYDAEVDTTLQASKTQAVVYIMPEFSLSDTFTPDLPPDMFQFLLEEATSRAQMKHRGFQDVKSEQEASRQRRSASRKNWRVHGGIEYPNYGRPTR